LSDKETKTIKMLSLYQFLFFMMVIAQNLGRVGSNLIHSCFY